MCPHEETALTATACNTATFEFYGLGGREVVGGFCGGDTTSDAGGLLLREVEGRTGIIGQFAACFTDYRDAELIEHTVEELVAQRTLALALGQKLLKIGTHVRVTTRRVWLSWSQAYPYQDLFRRAYQSLIRLAPILRPAFVPLRC